MSDKNEESGYSLETRVGILGARLSNIDSNLSELKSSLKRLEEVIGVVKLIEVQASNQSKEFDELSQSLASFNNQILKIHADFESRVINLDSKLNSSERSLKTSIDTVEASLLEKINIGRGVKLAAAVFIAAIIALSGFILKEKNAKLDAMYEFYLKNKKD